MFAREKLVMSKTIVFAVSIKSQGLGCNTYGSLNIFAQDETSSFDYMNGIPFDAFITLLAITVKANPNHADRAPFSVGTVEVAFPHAQLSHEIFADILGFSIRRLLL